MKNYRKYFAVGALALLSAATTQASTLLGDRYAGASASYDFNIAGGGDDVIAVGAEVNLPVITESRVHADLVLGTTMGYFAGDLYYGYQNISTAGLRMFMPEWEFGGDRLMPFVTATAGYHYADFDDAGDESFLWKAEVGVQYEWTDQITFVPSVGYSRMTSYDVNDWLAKLDVVYSVSEQLSAVVSINHSDVDGEDSGYLGFGGGVRYAF